MERKKGGLRRRWILNTVGVLMILGLACVLAVTAVFAANYYSSMEADMHYRAKTITEFFAEHINQSYNEYYQSCITYAQTFEERNSLELQFINAKGELVASSYGPWAGGSPTTSDIQEAVSTRGIRTFRGKNPATGERIMAVSSPMTYSNGEVIGVLRFVTSTRLRDRQIMQIAMIATGVLLLVVVIVLLSSVYFIHNILVPLGEITEKAKRIAGGTYGIQLQTKYRDEIGDLADAINELSAKISQNERMQSEFISSLSHELRTPLTAITGWSETILGDDSLDPDTRRGMKIIAGEAKRLTEMVYELLDFTKLQDGKTTLNMEMSDLEAAFEDIVYMYGSRLAQEGITLRYLEHQERIPRIVCDAKRLRQVFLNILDNAAKHGGDGKKIDASIHYENGYVIIQIRDYGAGIPEDELKLVKKKFYRGTSKARGTGIGLAVCEEIVGMHNGKLTLENASGGGTLVTVSIPAVQ